MKTKLFAWVVAVAAGALAGCRMCDVAQGNGVAVRGGSPTEKMATASFLYRTPRFACCMPGNANGADRPEERTSKEGDDWKAFLASEVPGLSWPEGTGLTLEPLELSEDKILRVTNTLDNLRRLQRWWAEMETCFRIALDVRIVEVDEATLAAVEWSGSKDIAGGGGKPLDAAAMLDELLKRNDVKTIAAPKMLARSGEEVLFKSVTEYIYPTDFEVKMPTLCGLSGESCATNDAPAESKIVAVEPQSFTMREAGVIVDVTPTLEDSGVMDIRLQLSIVGDPEWRDYGMTAIAPNGEKYDLPMETPQFPVFSIYSPIFAVPGETVYTGGLSGAGNGNEKTILVFITPRLCNLREFAPSSTNPSQQ